MTTGLCYTIEALIEFFQMQSQGARPTKHNLPPFHNIHVDDKKKKYFDEALNEFVGTYLLPLQESPSSNEQRDGVMNYSLSLLRYYFIIVDFKDAVREGNGE
jgi:hypothetical protein